jgi:hypothetical protein
MFRGMISESALTLGVFAQTRDIFGAYFPSWLLCVLVALAATAVVRTLFVRAGIDRSLPVPVVVYLALVVAFSFGGWLLCLS